MQIMVILRTLIRYSDWLPRKSILKLANWTFADLRQLRARKRENIWNIKKASHSFVVYHLLIDIVQFVWSYVRAGRQVIQFSK